MGASTSPYGAHPTSTRKEFSLGAHQGFYTCHQGSCILALTFKEFNMEIR